MHLNPGRFWPEVVGNAAKDVSESPELGMKGGVEGNQEQEPGGGEGPRGPGPSGTCKEGGKQVPCSGHPPQQRMTRGKSSRGAEAQELTRAAG